MNHVTKAWAFLILISIVLIFGGHQLLGREGLLIGLVLALGLNFYVYFYEDRRVLSHFKGKELEGQDPWKVLELARKLSAKARVVTPRVIVLEENSPQALVVGRSLTHGTIILTRGLLERLSTQELEAVIAYQISCIRTLNTLSFSVGSFLSSCALFVSESMDLTLRILIVEKKNPDYVFSQLFTRMAAPFIGLLLKVSVRPSAYILADELASELVNDPQSVAQVLWKLESFSATEPFAVPISTAHMFIVPPLKRSWMQSFRAHPPLEKRIRTLLGYYPL